MPHNSRGPNEHHSNRPDNTHTRAHTHAHTQTHSAQPGLPRINMACIWQVRESVPGGCVYKLIYQFEPSQVALHKTILVLFTCLSPLTANHSHATSLPKDFCRTYQGFWFFKKNNKMCWSVVPNRKIHLQRLQARILRYFVSVKVLLL